MKNSNETVYAIYTPSEDPMKLPGYKYEYIGKMTDKKMDILKDCLKDTQCKIVRFKSEKDFDQTMEKLDDAFNKKFDSYSYFERYKLIMKSEKIKEKIADEIYQRNIENSL